MQVPTWIGLIFSASLSAVMCSEDAAAQPLGETGDRPTLEQFLKIRVPATPVMLPDGSILMQDWPDGIWQLYRVVPKGDSYASGEATFTKLTEFPDGLSSFSVSPDGKKVVLANAPGGNENTQLTLLDLSAAGMPRSPIVANLRVQAKLDSWLPDSSGVIYSANDESPSDFYLYKFDFATGKATKLLARPGDWQARGITKDGSRVLVSEFKSASESNCYELSIDTGELRAITIRPSVGAEPVTATCSIVGYTPDEASVLIVSDASEGRKQLFLYDLKPGSFQQPVVGLNKHEIATAQLNNARELLAVETNEDGYGVLHVYSLPDFKLLPFPQIERGGTSFQWSPGRALAWSNSNVQNPGASMVTAWRESAEGGSPEQTTRQVTFPFTGGIDLSVFPLPELIRYESFDGTEIPAFVFVPPGYMKGTPIPFVVIYHGGPEGQSRPYFSALQAYLLSEGLGIMLPNVRGSTGYGRAFQMMDDYKKRWDSVRDGVEAAEWLVKNHYSAPGKIATLGGSYGGFMSVACLVEDQRRVETGGESAGKKHLFGAAVDIVGIVNFKTFLEKTAGYRRKLREAEYGSLSDPEFLLSVSNISHVDQIKVPVFIGHGFNDPRVPVEEAMQLAIALKDRDIPVSLFIAPDEGHGFAKLENRLYFYSRVVPFLRAAIGSGSGLSWRALPSLEPAGSGSGMGFSWRALRSLEPGLDEIPPP
jgi:dipeptidyl aminopeptidase/acylaminoacyl peptidase